MRRLLCWLTRHQGWQVLSDTVTFVTYEDARGVERCGLCDGKMRWR